MVVNQKLSKMSEIDKAHEAWLKERDDLVKRLRSAYDMLVVNKELKETIFDAIVFIMGSEMK